MLPVAGHEESMQRIVEAGHEFANHMPADRSYEDDTREVVDAALRETNDIITQFQPDGVRWFR